MEFRGNNGNPFPEKWTLSIAYTKGTPDDKGCGTTAHDTEHLARAAFVGAKDSLPNNYRLTSAYLYPPQGEGAAINLLTESVATTAAQRR